MNFERLMFIGTKVVEFVKYCLNPYKGYRIQGWFEGGSAHTI